MSKIPKKTRDKKNVDHQRYISRITKTLYYGKFPRPDGLSLPVTELAAELFSEAQRGRSLDRLHCDDAANISRKACVSPCSLVIALLYLERLKKICPEYLERTASSDLFLVSLMVSCKFLYDDGEADEVFIDEWALSGGTTVKQLVQLEKDFLKAIEWEVFVSELTFWKKLHEIEQTLARKQGACRGFFTYTELEALLTAIELQSLIQTVVSMSALLIASYIVAVFALFGSVFIVSHIPGTYLQPKFDICENDTLIPVTLNSECGDVETDIPDRIQPSETPTKSEIPTLNVIKTSIFLASIESFLKPFCNKSESVESPVNDDNVQNVSWDWWTAPTLKWLSETSALIERKVELPTWNLLYFQYLYETYIQVKFLDLEDQVHRATKVRAQDRLENSWHTEWTDTIRNDFYDRDVHYYLENVKS
ncbi:protein CNPPD1 isoform X2 [Zophobas morio]|uniref:protein CNPPD1 isoform X2 n=1 Tax=Zophobas morio TaxID=2755281 RepID=UPI003082D351